MGETYFNLKHKLEQLGYNNILPLEAVPLVECILADLLQTTRSLQHYMKLSKEALMQRDSLMLEAEPYKCDNAKLIQENNQMHKEIIHLKEESTRFNKDTIRKMKLMSEEIIKKDTIINKLQHEIRDLSLRGICAETQSSRNKSKRKESEYTSLCMCHDRKISNSDNNLTELIQKLNSLEEKNQALLDEIIILKTQVEHRDNEIVRLNILLEGGRPLTAIMKDCCNINVDSKLHNLIKDLQEMEAVNDNLKKDFESSLEKQHEAMLRALSLADKNKALQEELQKVDNLALKVEDNANKRLCAMMDELNFMQIKLENLILKNSELERELSINQLKESSSRFQKLQESLNVALKENSTLRNEIKDLVNLNKSLQDKIMSLSNMSNTFQNRQNDCDDNYSKNTVKCPTRDELQVLLVDERKKYERYIKDIQERLMETMNDFNKHHLQKNKNNNSPKQVGNPHEVAFIKDLHTRLCESEQKNLILKKENDELTSKLATLVENNKLNYKDIISQLNIENNELSKENMTLSQQLSHYKNLNLLNNNDTENTWQKDTQKQVQKLKEKIEQMSDELLLLKKDKQEYNLRYKEAMNLVDKLKRDLVSKQKEMEHLEEENYSYKQSNRSGQASTEQLKDECNYLREQIRKIQSDVIKEKTLSSQIKNIQLQTERSTTEIQSELLCTQKKLGIAKETIDMLEKKCKELQTEITTLTNDKCNLIENIKKMDQERDQLIIELDHKVESNSTLEQKLKSKVYEITKLENEVSELTRKLNLNKVSEHKIVDYEAQIHFLNSEILKLTQQFDNMVIENKQLQNSLADANGKLKITKIEYEKSRKEVDSLKQQLQHYVAEVRRIEELLSQKEAERSDMLEQFASLSVEANILENTNHSLENESASKSVQLQSYTNKIQSIEAILLDKDTIIDNQSSTIASLRCKITALEKEVKLINEEKSILEQNVCYLKQMCNNLQRDHTNVSTGLKDSDSELKLYENRIKSLAKAKENLEGERDEVRDKLSTTEKLLSNARREVVELKLALQDATSETKSLQDSVNILTRRESENQKVITTE